MTKFTGTNGTDNLIGTDNKSDIFRFSPVNLSAADTVVGGVSGNDHLEFTASGTVTASLLSGVSGIEVISLKSGGISLQLSDAFASANGRAGLLSIKGSKGADTVDASALTGGRRVTFDSGGGDDNLTGGSVNDNLNGGDGRDRLAGGDGADQLSGGGGGDWYVFNAVSNSSSSGGNFSATTGDTIAQFTSAAEKANPAKQDKIDLSGLVSAIGHSLAWNGTTAAANAIWATVSGRTTTVRIDTSGDGIADMAFRISSSEKLSAADFVGLSYVDNGAPSVVSVNLSDTALKIGDSSLVTIVFSEAVTGFSNADVSADNGTFDTFTSTDGGVTWKATFTPTADIEDTTNVVTVAASYTDVAGNAGSGAASGNYEIDTLAPGAPTIDLNAASDTGPSDTDNNTSDTTPTLTITAEAGATVEVFRDGVSMGLATETATPGRFTFTSSALADGLYSFTATATDEAGNVSPASTALGVSIQVSLDIDAATMTATQGFRIFGADDDDAAGRSVSSAGDINGDGFDDLIVGVPFGDGATNSKLGAGEAIVVFGKASGFTDIDVATLTAAQGFRIFGADEDDFAGFSVSSAGDINGDGFDDLIVGAFSANGATDTVNRAGEAIVVFGHASGFTDIDVATMTSSQGFRIFGADEFDLTGFSVSSAGDINGDGFDDLIVGAYYGDGATNGKSYAGEAIVVFGKASGFTDIDLTAMTSAQGFRIFGADIGDQAGFSVSSAGNINGDGFDDLIIGAQYGDGAANGKSDAGEAIVVFGKASGFDDIDVATMTAAQGFRIFGAAGLDQAGVSVSSAGDINGDGFDDLIVGALYGDGTTDTKTSAGEAIVVFGKASGFADIDVATMTAAQGFRIFGADSGDRAGLSVSSAGDINGDGFDDLIIGVPSGDGATNSKSAGGEAIVVFGKASGFTDIDVSTLTAVQGFRIFGADAGDQAGFSVSSAGDINGDGFDDLIVGTDSADGAVNGKRDAGEAIVVFGGDFLGGVIFAGTNGADTLTGTAAAETFVGGQDDDILIGNGGADAFQGGEGNDIIAVIGTDFRKIDGGAGFDMLRADGSGDSFDFSGISPAAVSNIEAFDLTGIGNNSLVLSALDIFDLSDDTSGGFTRLTVHGDAGDTVSTLDSGWTDVGDVTIGGDSFNIFQKGQAQLVIDTDILFS